MLLQKQCSLSIFVPAETLEACALIDCTFWQQKVNLGFISSCGVFFIYEGTQGQGEEYYDPARKDNILRRKQTRLGWEEHRKDPILVLDKALKCPENPYQG